MKTPASVVSSSVVALVSWLVTTTAAPGSTAPVLSVTVPVMVAERICAAADAAQAKQREEEHPEADSLARLHDDLPGQRAPGSPPGTALRIVK